MHAYILPNVLPFCHMSVHAWLSVKWKTLFLVLTACYWNRHSPKGQWSPHRLCLSDLSSSKKEAVLSAMKHMMKQEITYCFSHKWLGANTPTNWNWFRLEAWIVMVGGWVMCGVLKTISTWVWHTPHLLWPDTSKWLGRTRHTLCKREENQKLCVPKCFNLIYVYKYMTVQPT